MIVRWLAVVSLVIGSAVPALALDAGDGKLSVNGFGRWGYGRTGGANRYFIGSERGEYDNAQFSLAVNARPAPDVVVAGQLFVVSQGEVRLDWAFAEYRFDDLLRVRAGKVKNPFGLFMEVKDVGTLRPFFALPQTIYGPGNVASESYLGAGFTGEWMAETGWASATTSSAAPSRWTSGSPRTPSWARAPLTTSRRSRSRRRRSATSSAAGSPSSRPSTGSRSARPRTPGGCRSSTRRRRTG
jgi:hypothetical protein